MCDYDHTSKPQFSPTLNNFWANHYEIYTMKQLS